MRNIDLNDDEKELVEELKLLTSKPVIYVANIDDRYDKDNIHLHDVVKVAEKEDSKAVTICAATEAELSQLSAEEAEIYRSEFSLNESGLIQLVHAAFSQLNLVTFYTVKGPETRAWLIPRGTTANKAARRIHSDIERGFIRAEVVNWQDLVRSQGFQAAKEVGKVRIEGKEYAVEDGDVILFRFNV